MILDTKRKRAGRSPQYKTTTVRQFDGGWNVIDNELTLSPRFARVFDNFVRGNDGSVAVRYGYGLFKDLRLGDETTTSPSVTLTTTTGATARRVKVNWTAHGLSSSQHVTFSGLTTYQGIPAAELNRTHSVHVFDANSIYIIVTTPAVGAGTSGAGVITAVKDTHMVGGEVINGTYFQDYLILVTSVGEVIKLDADGNATLIWNAFTSASLSGAPVGWGATEFVSFHVFGGKLHIHNGVDKPLEVDTNASSQCIFLGDPATGGSNAFVPVGRIGFSSGGFAMVAGIPDDVAKLQISANLAAGVWTGNPSPDDAVDIDLSKVSNSLDIEIIGLAELRDRLLVTFRDNTSVGQLGLTKTVGSSILHDPAFKDNIPQHGCISHRTIVSLGNDIFMCDRVGVPSVAQSQLSGQFVPDRVSDLIEPALQQNINRLNDDTLTNKTFAVYNPQDRQYMLFIPKFDADDTRTLTNNPISFLADLGAGQFMVFERSHGLEADDTIVVAGAVDIGDNLAASINGSHTISSVIDDDYYIVDTGNTFTDTDITGGGSAVTIHPTTQETIGYVYSFNPKLKVRAWSRFRGMNFQWGAKSANGNVFFGKGGKVYQYGSKQRPYYGDQVGDYDAYSWSAGNTYPVGYRIYDSTDNTVYEALVEHLSVGASFSAARIADTDLWTEYKGEPIKFAWEWPWGDFDKRLRTKSIGAIYPDASGSGEFDLKIFVDQIYKDAVGQLTPVRTMGFTGGDSPGYGAGDQPFGGGRRTKEQLLWPIPVIGKLLKLRVEGETTDPLRIIAISIIYKEGSMKR